ncbi:MAG: MBL fold metallo-hydrolase [Treponemataceae bacterium]
MKIKLIYTGKLFVKTYCFMLQDNIVAVVDPGGTDEELLDHLKELNAKSLSIMLTHGHFDHLGGVAGLLKIYPESKIYIHKADANYLGETAKAEHLKCFAQIRAERYINQYEEEYKYFPAPTDIINDGDIVNGFQVIHTPGHTPGSVCFYHSDKKILFSGDTLFYHSHGRTDLYGGNDNDIAKSLKKLLTTLPPETSVYTGHGSNTTIEKEQKNLARFL